MSKLALFKAAIRIKIGHRFGWPAQPYVCNLKSNGRSARIHMFGTYDELAILEEVFILELYKPLMEPVTTILDLGANIGLATIWFHLNYPDAQIHAYEMSASPFNVLQKNVTDLPNIKIFNEAIAPREGTVLMNESKRSVESSIAFELPNAKKVPISAVTLDQAVDALGGHVDVLKIDIEGIEFDLFNATKKLSSIGEMVGELHHGMTNRSPDEIRDSLALTHTLSLSGEGGKAYHFYAAPISNVKNNAGRMRPVSEISHTLLEQAAAAPAIPPR